MGEKWRLTAVLMIMIGDVEYLFKRACWPFRYLLWRQACLSSLPVFDLGCLSSVVEFGGSPCGLDISPLLDIDVQILSPILLLFCSVGRIF